MDLRTRFTLFLSLISFVFLGTFSTVVYHSLRAEALAHEEQSLLSLLEHEWDHIDLPDHQSKRKPGVPHFKDVYLRIRKEGTILYDSFQTEVQEPARMGVDLEQKRIFHTLQRSYNGHWYQITGYFDLTSTLAHLRLLKNILFMGSLASLIILIPLSGAATRYFLKPFRHLADQTSRINADRLSYRFPNTPTQDEYGLLARNVNALLDRLERSFQSVKRFASSASHELRTPLSVIIGQSEMALRREREPAEYRQVISKTLTRAKDLRDIINRLLYLSEMESLEGTEREPIELRAFVDDILQTLIHAYEPHGKQIAINPVSPEVEILSHPQILASVISNLVENALKYSSQQALISWEIHGNELQLQIEDDGSGIPEDKQSLVFEPFIRLPATTNAPPTVKSLGLGLSIVRACLQSLHGTIQLGKSSLGGLRVQVRIPATA